MVVNKGGAVLRAAGWALLAAGLATASLSCLSNPCLHGICIDDINSTYSCYCVDGYTGVQCQTNWDECWSDPCMNGGTCIDGIATYNCSCPDGFIGDNCETNFNECESNPCLNNGTCIDMTNGYVCSCMPGFSGEHCELDVAVCNSTEEVRCHNGGQCIEGPGFKFYCKCSAGWAGLECADQIDECESNPCQNGGVCIDAHADYMCACTYGFTGKNCEVQIEFCDENSCSNDALCVVEDGARICYCVPDYHGERCELQYDECILGPRCMNGGTCIDGVDNFTCSCPPKLTGTFCECLILKNGSLDCEYVTPTPIPGSSQSTFLTTYKDLFTTDISTSLTTDYNDTRPKTIPTTLETDPWYLTTIPPETIYDTSSQEISTNTDNDQFESTLHIVDITTPRIDDLTSTQIINTSETGTQEESTTPDCTEDCKTSEYSTATLETANSELYTVPTVTIDVTETEQSVTTFKAITDMNLPGIEKTTLSTVFTTDFDASVSDVTKPVSAEITSTPKEDLTTEKMFTDTPTEHSMTDYPTPPTFTTTEAMDVTTTFSNTTYVYPSLPTECTESLCGGNGNCISTPHGSRCHCNFNYEGRFCEDKVVITSAAFGGNSYITHKLRNGTSISVQFNAKTLITDGQIMHVDIAQDVYMQLYMSSGLLKFKFSCGYQTMLLSELKTFVNKGYLMKIETRLDLYIKEQQCNATLRLNDTVAMSGGQVANISALHQNTTLYLGNSPSIKDSDCKPFVGCISNLKVNGDNRGVFIEALEAAEVTECSSLACLSAPCLNGGSCSDHGLGYICSCANGWSGTHCNESVCENNPCQAGGGCVRHPGSGFLCLCPYGRHGIFCEYNVEITRPSLAPISTGISSYLIYALSPVALNSDRFDLRLRFQTSDMDQIALLAFIGQTGIHDSRSQHLALTFVKGYLMLSWNMGSGPRRVFTSRPLSPRRSGHLVRVWRRGRSAGLSVDGRFNVSGNAPAHDANMTTLPLVFIGGHPSFGFQELPHDLPLHSGWRGCIWEVGGAAGAGGPQGGRGVGQCGVAQCTAKACRAPRGVCVHSPATYGCICNDGWFGATCSSTSNPCDSNVTQCLGKCVITAEDSLCDCPYGKTGINCDQELIPTDVLFTGVRSYAQLHPRTISSVSLSFEAEIKPSKERGLLLFAETPHFYTALSLQGGLLEYRWTDRLSGVTSLVRSGVVLPLRQWHSIRAGRYGSRLYVWADSSITTRALLAHAYPHTAANTSLWLGGAKDLSTLPFDVMSGAPEPFFGCIRNFHVNNILLPLEQRNIKESQNLADCDGTPCGVETCPGGKCILDQGKARCVCGGEEMTSPRHVGGSSVGGQEDPGVGDSGGKYGGARCRREAMCSRETCVAPAGHCRRGRCVCSAGRAGDNCDININITIPEFNGESLLSLNGQTDAMMAPKAGQTEEQRIHNDHFPTYFALNFTTAEPDGLLLWLAMGTDYLGVGLEKRILKLVWSFKSKNASHKNGKKNSKSDSSMLLPRLVPHAGFLSDAEWHLLVIRLDKANITLSVDQVDAYVEEPDFGNILDYNVDVFIGGINEGSNTIAKKIFPSNFKGCIDHISTKENDFLTDYKSVYSENIKMCQLFPIT